MVIKIGKLKIDFESRSAKHRGYLFNEIMALRNEIIDLVLAGETRNRINVHELKHKAKLIKKYSRRLKLLNT